MSKSRQNSNTPNRLTVANRAELSKKVGTRNGEILWQSDIGLGYTWTTTQGIDNGGTIINVGTGSWIASYKGAVNLSWFTDNYDDATTAISNAMSASKSVIIDGHFYIDGVGLLEEQTHLIGLGLNESSLRIKANPTSFAIVTVLARLCKISDMSIYGDANFDRTGIHLSEYEVTTGVYSSAQACRLDNLLIKSCLYGIHHESGNSVNASELFLESNTYGYTFKPLDRGLGNTNGCVIQGRAYNCEIGFQMLENDNPSSNPAMHNTIVFSTEGNTVGFKETAGRYNYIDIYSESNNRTSTTDPVNTNVNFSTVGSGNVYMIKNPDNEEDIIKLSASGYYTAGGNTYSIDAWSSNKIEQMTFTANDKLRGVGVNSYIIDNSSSTVYNMTLEFLLYAPIGWKTEIYSKSTVRGFTPTAPAGFTLLGNVAEFGNYVGGDYDKMEVIKLSSTEAMVRRYREANYDDTFLTNDARTATVLKGKIVGIA